MATDDFHPELRRIARVLPRAAVSNRKLRLMRILTGLPDRLADKDIITEGVGPITVRVHGPVLTVRPLPALLWIHGGGYVFGTATQDDAVCRHFAEKLGIVVAAVDYRLAPEYPYPVPLQDCYDALTWLVTQPYVDPTRVAVGGGSAGGGLAAALALLVRERGELKLAFQLLSYPMLDDRTAARTDIDEHMFRWWNNKANRFGWEAYTGHPPGSPEISGLAAPARYEDLSGLPPAWIGVGTLDLFYREDLDYVDRLRAAGVSCELDVVTGAFHGFDLVRPKASVTRTFRAAQVATLAVALG